MPIEIAAHMRCVEYAVAPEAARQALELRNAGQSLAKIRDTVAPGVSLPTISRAIERARKENHESA